MGAFRRMREMQSRKRDDAKLLRPKEVRLTTGLSIEWMAVYCAISMGVFNLITGILDGSIRRVVGAAILGLAGALGFWLTYRKQRNSAYIVSQESLAKSVPELEAVADILQGAFIAFELVVEYRGGPDAPLLPEVRGTKLVISRRFWQELTVEEQRCAMFVVKSAQIRRYRASVRILRTVMTLWFLPVVAVGYFVGLEVAGYVGLSIVLTTLFLGAPWIVDALAVHPWRKAALDLKTPNAPILLLRKLSEEAANSVERRHLERTLKAYERVMPEIQWEVEQFHRNMEIAERQAREREERALHARGGDARAAHSAPEDDHNEVKNR